MSCPYAGNQNSSEVVLSSTWLNWSYFSLASVSPITGSQITVQVHAWNSVLLRFSTRPIVLIYCPPNFQPADRSDFPASCRSQRFILHSLDFLHLSQMAIDHSCTADTHFHECDCIQSGGNPENPCVTASIWLHPDSMSISISEEWHHISLPSPAFLPSWTKHLQSCYCMILAPKQNRWKEIWHLSVTRVHILQMGWISSLWLVVTLLTSKSHLPLDRRHLPFGDAGKGWDDIRPAWEIMC